MDEAAEDDDEKTAEGDETTTTFDEDVNEGIITPVGGLIPAGEDEREVMDVEPILTGTALFRAAIALAMEAEFDDDVSGEEALEELAEDVVVVVNRAGRPDETVTNLLTMLVVEFAET